MNEAVEPAVAEKASLLPGEDKKVWSERVLNDILRLMELPAKLDFKDAEDGSLSVALHFESPVPGVVAGKRSLVLDALQLLVNKIVNPPGIERRWVNLGAFGHPLPRGAKKPVAPVAVPVAAAVAEPVVAKNGKARTTAVAVSEKPKAFADESKLKVAADKALSAAAKALFEKSAKFGRFYGVFAMSAEDRARMLSVGGKAKGVSAKAEGEGNMRRVVLTPETPKPMPKYVMPDYGDDEEDAED